MIIYLFKLLIVIVFIIILLNVWIYIQQPGMIFYPDSSIVMTPRDWDMEYQDVQLKSKDGVNLHGWYLPVKNSKKLVLFFHGNAGNISHRGDSIKIFHELRLNVLIIDYRSYGKSEGKASESGLYEDAATAWNYLQQTLGYSPDDIIIFGRSLGGAIATELATKVNAGGLIVESSFSSIKQMSRIRLPFISRLVYSRYSFDTESKINQVRFPVLVIHSPDDEMIPYSFGEKIFNAANSPKYFYKMTGSHNEGFQQSMPEYRQQLEIFIQSLDNSKS